MAASEETWAEVKRAYEETRETQVSIADRAGMTYRALYNRARKDGWKRPDVSRKLLLSPSPPAAREARRPGESLTDQVTRIARMNLDLLEQYMERGDIDVGSPEHERVTRVTGAVTGAITKLGDLAVGGGAHERAGTAGDGRTAADIERRRHEIAERLERVLARRHAAGLSG